MPFFKINVDLMNNYITSLNRYKESQTNALNNVFTTRRLENYPVDIENSEFGTYTISNATANIGTIASDLKTRLDEAKRMNENGLLPKDKDGNVSYYLPDFTVDTAENVTASNSKAVEAAKKDAKQLWSDVKNNPGSDSAAYQSMLVSKDNPIYASVFIDTLDKTDKKGSSFEGESGAEVVLGLINGTMTSDFETSSTGNTIVLATLLAYASQDEVGGEKLVQDIYKDGGKNLQTYERHALNFALSGVQNAPPFGTKFLKTLAAKAENDTTGTSYTRTIDGKVYNADVLAGAMLGMADNPQAALEYLTGSGSIDRNGNWIPDEATKKRWEKLANRSWDAGCTYYGPGTDAFTAAQAAVSAYRNLDDKTAGTKNADARATWLAGRTIDLYSSDQYSTGGWTKFYELPDESKRNLAIVLSNSPEEIAGIADGSVLKDVKGPKLPNSGIKISTLLYRILDNEDAAATLAGNMGEFHRKRTEQTLDDNKGLPKDKQLGILQTEYQGAAQTRGFLGELTRRRYEDIADRNKDTQNAVDTAAAIFSAVAVGAVTVGTAGMATPAAAGIPAAAAVIAEGAKPVVSAAAMAALSDPTQSSGAPQDPRDMLEGQAFSDAAKRGLFSEDSTNKSANNEGIVLNKDDHKKLLTDEHNNKVDSWRKAHGGDVSVANTSRAIGDGLDDGVGKATKNLPKGTR